MTREELLQMRNMSFDDVNEEDVMDIKELEIDVTKSKQEKIQSVLETGVERHALIGINSRLFSQESK